MQIWSCASIVTVPGEEKHKSWLCLLLVRDVLYAGGVSTENTVLGAEWFGVDSFGECWGFVGGLIQKSGLRL